MLYLLSYVCIPARRDSKSFDTLTYILPFNKDNTVTSGKL